MIVQNVNQIKLHKELDDAGIKCTLKTVENGVNIIFLEDADMQLVQSIIDVHDPTPIPPEPTDKERIEQLENMILMMMEVM